MSYETLVYTQIILEATVGDEPTLDVLQTSLHPMKVAVKYLSLKEYPLRLICYDGGSQTRAQVFSVRGESRTPTPFEMCF